MTQKRKQISKKIRFEVFKRDNFTCQYCGKQAPDVILEVDHIKPVCKGGDNNIFNLITSCKDCNRGKRGKKLSDKSEIKKQKKQLDILSSQREQIKMLEKWREELKNNDKETADFLEKTIQEHYKNYGISEYGKSILIKLTKKYEIKEIIEAIDIAYDKYFVIGKEDETTRQNWNLAFNKISGILNIKKLQKINPILKDIFYCRGILNNRIYYVNQITSKQMLKVMINKIGFDETKDICCNVNNWTEFVKIYNDMENENDK